MRTLALLLFSLAACGTPADPDSGADVPAPIDTATADATDTAVADSVESGASDVVTDAPPVDARPGCVDADGDGYGTGAGCLGPDCNDADRAVHPGAMERCDGVDSNCDGSPDTGSTALDAYCVSTCNGEPCTYALPPICFYPGRTDANYTRTTVAHCQACRRDPSNPSLYSCTCWLDGASEVWRCDSRP